jgi:hypothetical protein
MAATLREDTGEAISLAIPAQARYFPVARSVVTAVGAGFELPVDVLDDLRLAVAECCNLLIGPTIEPSQLTLRLWSEDGALVMQVAAQDASIADEKAPFDSLSWTIIVGLADEANWETTDGVPAVLTRWRALSDSSP